MQLLSRLIGHAERVTSDPTRFRKLRRAVSGVALLLSACSSDSSPTGRGTDAGQQAETGGTTGNGGNGGSPKGTGGAGRGECIAPAPKLLAQTKLAATDLRVVGSDLYLLDDTATGHASNIRHVEADGSVDEVVYAAPAQDYGLQSLWVTETTAYFIEQDPAGDAALYRVALTGGTKTLVSTKKYASGSATIAGVDAASAYVITSTGGGNELRRVSLSDGSETVIAAHTGLAFKDPQIVGRDIWFMANSGLDGYFKAPLDASTSSAVQVSSETCRYQMSVTSAGVFCSSATGLWLMPLSGAPSSRVLELDGGVDVSRPDGDFVYLLPLATNDIRKALRKYPIAGGSPTDVACDRSTMKDLVFDATGVYWLETDASDTFKMDLFALAK
jgi:hypothetical protein